MSKLYVPVCSFQICCAYQRTVLYSEARLLLMILTLGLKLPAPGELGQLFSLIFKFLHLQEKNTIMFHGDVYRNS